MTSELSIQNIHGLTLTLSTYGARITSLKGLSRGKEYEFHEFYEDIDIYKKERPYSGALIGPFANRIARASFELNGKQYKFSANEGHNLLHAGELGWHAREWTIKSQSDDMVVFYLDDRLSEWPGALECYVTYQVTADQSVIIQMECLGQSVSQINLTSHGYFNLDGTDDLSHHQFEIRADSFTELDEEQIPTGKIKSVNDTFLDHRNMKNLEGPTIDHNYVIRGEVGEMRIASKAKSTLSGISMTTYSTQPGLQVYTGNGRYFCMETQHFPDSVNHEHFMGTRIEPPLGYKEQCIYSFSGLDQKVGLMANKGFSLPRA